MSSYFRKDPTAESMASAKIKNEKAEQNESAILKSTEELELDIFRFVRKVSTEEKKFPDNLDRLMLRELNHGTYLRIHHLKCLLTDDQMRKEKGQGSYVVGSFLASVEHAVNHELERKEVRGLGTVINVLIIKYHVEKVKTELKMPNNA